MEALRSTKPGEIEQLEGASAAVTTRPLSVQDLAQRFSLETQTAAYELYLVENLKPGQIAERLSLPHEVVAHWSASGKWMQRKQAQAKALMRQAEARYRIYTAEKLQGVVEQHHDVSEALIDKIKTMLDQWKNEGKSPEIMLKRLAEALKAAADVSARAVGLDALANPKIVEAGKGGGDGKRPVVIIGVQAAPASSVEQGPGPTGSDAIRVIELTPEAESTEFGEIRE